MRHYVFLVFVSRILVSVGDWITVWEATLSAYVAVSAALRVSIAGSRMSFSRGLVSLPFVASRENVPAD